MELDEMTEEQIESEALKQGYNPNYEGENKKTPKEFLEVALTHNHVLKERNEKLSSQFDEIKAELATTREMTKKLVSNFEEQKKKAVEKAISALKAERKEAIADGDADKVEKIDEEIDRQKENVAKPVENPIFTAWVTENPWYHTNKRMGAKADTIAKELVESGRYDDQKEIFDTVADEIKRLYPEAFVNPKKGSPEVEGGRQSPTKTSKKSYADLPADAKAACDEFVSNKLMTREEYVTMYEWE